MEGERRKWSESTNVKSLWSVFAWSANIATIPAALIRIIAAKSVVGKPGIHGIHGWEFPVVSIEHRCGFVYLISAANGLIKIGRAKDPAQRFGEINLASPVEIRLLHFIRCKDMIEAEAFLHWKFRWRRVRGEWFRLYPNELDFIMAHHVAPDEWERPLDIVTNEEADRRMARRPSPKDL